MGLAPTAPVTAQRVRDGEPAALAALVDRRGAAVLAYCEQVAAPGSAAAAAGDAFARFRLDVVAADHPRALDPESVLLRGTRQAAAAAATRTVATRGLLARRLGTTCVLVPELLAARAEGTLTAADRLRLSRHVERCAACREAEERFAAGELAYHEAPSGPPPSEVADQLHAALRDAAPNADREPAAVAEPATAEGVAAGNGSPPPTAIPDHPTLAWDATDVAAADAGTEGRGLSWVATRVLLPVGVFLVAFVAALALAGVFGHDGGDASSIQTQSADPPTQIRVHARPVTTPLPGATVGAVPTPTPQASAPRTAANTIVVTSKDTGAPAVPVTAAQPEPQLSAQTRRSSEASAPPPEQSAPATTTTDPGFQPSGAPPTP